MMTSMYVAPSELISQGRAALRAGDAAAARQAFVRARDHGIEGEGASGPVLEGLARASYLEFDYTGAITGWEQAFGAYRAGGDTVGAVRVARTLAYMNFSIVGDGAVGSGWSARAQTLLAQAPDSPEHGWVALNRGMFEGNRERKEGLLREALRIARGFRDLDLELATLAYLGASLVHADRTEEGMMLLDEALAAVVGNEVDDFTVLQEIFCQLFAACEHAHDVVRADQWIRIGETLAERRRLPAVSAFCRTHYGAILTAAGRWPEADAALSDAVRLWGLGHRFLRAGALVRLADLRVRQGRYEEAEQLLGDLDPTSDSDVARTRAAIHMARGELEIAGEILERAITVSDPTGVGTASLLALLVDVRINAHDLDGATAATEQLATCVEAHPIDYLVAVAALARGRVCLARGSGDPRACLREALAGFTRAHMPIEVARSRLELAAALVTERPEVALAEARTALEVFDRLQAARDGDAAAALLRSLGVRAPAARRGGAVLTSREAEVLDLIGRGLSNPEIAERLYISRKTVEHHVGNILAKLGLRSRGEAAAYANRQEQGTR